MIDTIGADSFSTIVAALLTRQELARALRVCREWLQVIDQAEHVWGALCHQAWVGKVYVPASLRELAKGAAFVAEASAQRRAGLSAMRVGELKQKMTEMRVRVAPGQCVEKKDFVDAIEDNRKKRAELGTAAEKLVRAPFLLVRRHATRREGAAAAAATIAAAEQDQEGAAPNVLLDECLPKAALRLSLADASRTRITADELVSFVFHVRVRADGPLAQAVPFDPYWAGGTFTPDSPPCGQARFTNDGLSNCYVNFTWPKDLLTKQPKDPFAAMGMPQTQTPGALEWRIELQGSTVQIAIMGQDGPQEVVSRHPENWGFVLFSQATLWASWPLPPKEKPDPVLADENLWKLRTQVNVAEGYR